MWIGKLLRCILVAMLVIDRSNGAFLGFNGTNRRERQAGLRAHETACSEDDYISTYICPTGKVLGLTCIDDMGQEKANYADARAACEAQNMALLKVDSEADHQEIVKYFDYLIDEGRIWIGLSQDANDDWFWHVDGTLVRWDMWFPGEPNNMQSSAGSEDCVEMDHDGWNDIWCTRERFFLCGPGEEIDPSPWILEDPIVTIEPPGSPYLDPGELFTVTCTAYKLRFEKIVIQMIGINLLDNSVAYFKENGADTESEHGDSCAPSSCSRSTDEIFHNAGGMCVRRSYLRLELRLINYFYGGRFRCMVWSTDAFKYEETPTVQGPRIYQPNLRPQLQLNRNTDGIPVGAVLQWTCNNTVGTGATASFALVSNYHCGDYLTTSSTITQVTFTNRTGTPCLKVMLVDYTGSVPQASMFQDYIRFEARATIIPELDGAIIACFSYRADRKWKEGTLVDYSDPFAVYSDPIRVIGHRESGPDLTVNYHKQPSVLYKNFDLTSYCDANVGQGGKIVWTLKTKTGETRYETENGTATYPGIRIDQHPATGSWSCPVGWRRNPTIETCVKILDEPYSWEDARMTCQSHGSDLAQIYSADALSFMNSFLGSDGYWIGLHDWDGDGRFTWWSDDDREVTVENTDWVRMEMREKSRPIPYCVFMHNKMWYTHPCFHKLRPICETQPPPGISFDGDFLRLGIGHKMRSMFTIKVDESLEEATLACEIVPGPTSDMAGQLMREESEVFSVMYGPMEPRFIARWEMYGDTLIGHLGCSAAVGTGGSLSFAIFSSMSLKYLYTIGLNGQVRSVKPAPGFEVTEIKVTRTVTDGPAIAVVATVSTQEELYSPFAMCYSREVDPDETFRFERNQIALRNREYDPPPLNVVPLLLLGLLLLLSALTALFLTRKAAPIAAIAIGEAESDEKSKKGSTSKSQ